MKKFLIAPLGILAVLSLSFASVPAESAQPQSPSIHAQQKLASAVSFTDGNSAPALTPLRGGNGKGGTGPQDGTGNKNGARNGGGTGDCTANPSA